MRLPYTYTRSGRCNSVAHADCHYYLRTRLNNFTRQASVNFCFFFYITDRCRNCRYSREQQQTGSVFTVLTTLLFVRVNPVNPRDTRPVKLTALDPRRVRLVNSIFLRGGDVFKNFFRYVTEKQLGGGSERLSDGTSADIGIGILQFKIDDCVDKQPQNCSHDKQFAQDCMPRKMFLEKKVNSFRLKTNCCA